MGEPIVLSGGEVWEDATSIKNEGAGGGANVATTEAGRRVGGDARARPRPEVTAGRLGGALVAAQ